MARLRLQKGFRTWREVRIDSPLTRIGRDRTHCRVLLDKRTVSRKHAEIVRTGDEYFLVDRFSKAGTFLDGQRMTPGQLYPLKGKAAIRICNFVLMFLDDSKVDESLASSVEISDTELVSSVSSVLEGSSSSRLSRTNINPEAKLAAITDLTQALRRVRSLEDLLGKTLDSLLKVFGVAERVLVKLAERDGCPPQACVVRHRNNAQKESKAVINASLVNEVTERQATALSQDESTMCASLMGCDECPLGVIQLDAARPGHRFTYDDLDLLATMAAETAFVIDGWILHETALRERALQLELQLANEVQIGLLPDTPPDIEGYGFFDCYSPARQVGGDYFDYIELEDHRLAIVLGDVSGKGVPAAILMAKVSSEISAFLGSRMSPLEVINRVNTRLTKRSPDCRFVTMVLAELDLRTHELALVNAGHMLPLLRRADGSVVEIGEGCSGLPLGIEQDHPYGEFRSSLNAGDTLVLYSDGVTDASSAGGDMFGVVRLRSAVTTSTGDAVDIGRCIMDGIHDHVGDEPQTDDICLLCVSRHT